jgi:hypothetical protein
LKKTLKKPFQLGSSKERIRPKYDFIYLEKDIDH